MINCSIQARSGWHGFSCFWRILARKVSQEPIIAKISQETLAEMIGTTRSSVSFFMNKFRELGLIDYNGHIEVHSSLLNVVLHDQPQSTALKRLTTLRAANCPAFAVPSRVKRK